MEILHSPSFGATLRQHGTETLRRDAVSTVQLNVGRLCNLACHHCHVEAGPKRTEIMEPEIAERVIELLAASPTVETLDLTGGAPEMNPSFRRLVVAARGLGRRVIDRCNLTILLEPGEGDLTAFMAANHVEIVASLPCYMQDNVEGQRGSGVFEPSIEALRSLNNLGYGQAGSPLRLDLVFNPLGASLPPSQTELEGTYRQELWKSFGIVFDRLLTITNMPIRRFADQLSRRGETESYQALLVDHFNPDTVDGLMCRSQVSVDWRGRIHDCDFNLMLGLPARSSRHSIWEIDSFDRLEETPVATGSHCFGCTAGAGSSCSGALS